MRKIIRHASLFSGIGAPELAALWLGWQNVFHCEINEFCNTILNYWFPNSINYENIKTTDFSKWQGQIDILTGGFPCQPFSSAGQRLGADDDRYLWPEMLRVIRQIQPTFVIGENVAGILSMVQPGEEVKVGSTTSLFDENDDIYKKEQEFVVETVCSDLEREGYAVQPFVIPACAVGAPHQRDRVWFVARRDVPTPTADTLHEGVLRGPCVDEGEGEAQRLQERNEVQQPTEPSGLLRHSSHASNTRAEGMRERQTEVPFSRSAPHALSGGDTTQQAHQGTEGEGREDDGQQSQRRATPQRSDGLHQLSRHTADPECLRGNEMGYDIQPQQSDGVRADGDGYQWDVAYTECRRCDDGGSPRQERQNSTDTLRDSAQGNPDNEFQPRSCKDGSTPADTLRPGLQEEGRELQAEGIARDVPQMRLAADPKCERRDACHDDDGQPQGASQEERGAEQLGGADCPQDWWRDFPTVSPICRGNDGLPFDISRLTIPFTRWRQESIKALGNSMVPQVVLELFRAIEVEIFEE